MRWLREILACTAILVPLRRAYDESTEIWIWLDRRTGACTSVAVPKHGGSVTRKGKKPHPQVNILPSGCYVVKRYTPCDSGLRRARAAQKYFAIDGL